MLELLLGEERVGLGVNRDLAFQTLLDTSFSVSDKTRNFCCKVVDLVCGLLEARSTSMKNTAKSFSFFTNQRNYF